MSSTNQCPRCYVEMLGRNREWVVDPITHKTVPCPVCGGWGFRAELSEEYVTSCGLLPDQLERKLSDLELYDPQVKRMVAACADHITGEANFVLLYGQAGCGKSHAAQAVVASLVLGRGDLVPVQAQYWNVTDLLDYLRAGYDEGDFQTRQESLLGLPALVINDLDKAKGLRSGEWAYERLFNLIDHRYEAVARLRTLITMNGDPADVFKDEEPLWSRLLDTQRVRAISLYGQHLNYRLRQND